MNRLRQIANFTDEFRRNFLFSSKLIAKHFCVQIFLQVHGPQKMHCEPIICPFQFEINHHSIYAMHFISNRSIRDEQQQQKKHSSLWIYANNCKIDWKTNIRRKFSARLPLADDSFISKFHFKCPLMDINFVLFSFELISIGNGRGERFIKLKWAFARATSIVCWLVCNKLKSGL